MRNNLTTWLSVSLTAILCGKAAPASAWDDFGHQVVAQIAMDTLHNTPAGNKLEAMIAADTRTDRRDLLLFAIWPDLIKHPGKELEGTDLLTNSHRLSQWHFVDIPYSATKKQIHDVIELPGKDPTPVDESSGNVVTAIRFYANSLKNHTGDAQAQSDDLSMLIHLVGDVHQPLHCVTVLKPLPNYTPPPLETKPNGTQSGGDAGGNGFSLLHEGKIRNLHAFWDDQMDFENKKKPLSKEDRLKPDHAAVEGVAVRVMTAFPPSHFGTKLAAVDPADWARESYALRAKVYHTPFHDQPTADYASFAITTAEERIALAGYRLAELLKRISN